MRSAAAACPFCAIVAGDVPAEVVLHDDVVVAFLDRAPLFPGHVLVVPVEHVVTLPELARRRPVLRARPARSPAVVPGALGAQGTFVANNNVVSQSVAHLHVHVVPRTKGDGLRGFFWPRTKYRAGEAAVVATRRAATPSTETVLSRSGRRRARASRPTVADATDIDACVYGHCLVPFAPAFGRGAIAAP